MASDEVADRSALDGRMRLLTALVGATALATILGFGIADPHVDPIGMVAALLVLEALSWGSTFLMQPKAEADLWQLDEAIFCCAVVMVSPLGLLLTFAVGVPLGLVVARHRFVMLTYSGAMMTLAAAAGYERLGWCHRSTRRWTSGWSSPCSSAVRCWRSPTRSSWRCGPASLTGGSSCPS